jgi:hypothetical protein
MDNVDGTGSESSWSLISDDGALVDSDEFSISSEAVPPVIKTADEPADDDDQSNLNGSEYRCITEDSDVSEITDMTDVEEELEELAVEENLPQGSYLS